MEMVIMSLSFNEKVNIQGIKGGQPVMLPSHYIEYMEITKLPELQTPPLSAKSDRGKTSLKEKH